MSVSLQNVECVSRYSTSGHLQKFAADSTLCTSPKFTAMQNCHHIPNQQSKPASTCTLISSFISFSLEKLLFNPFRKLSCSNLIFINRYTNINKILYVKTIFRAPRFYMSSHSRLKNQSLSILVIS